MARKPVKFDLINNAKDSLSHAVEHLTTLRNPTAGDLKHAIRDVAHAVELLLKERLRRDHPAFIWQNIDKYPSESAFIISANQAVRRLSALCKVSLTKEARETIFNCKKIRDLIEHYEFQLNFKEAKGVIGRMLSFIFDFSKRHLGLDLESEFRHDDRWEKLVDIYEFWEVHSKTLERRLSEEGKQLYPCPSCASTTFDLSESKCLLCEHCEDQVECDMCHNKVWESEVEISEILDGDEEGVWGRHDVVMCKDCIERERAQSIADDMAADTLRDEYR